MKFECTWYRYPEHKPPTSRMCYVTNVRAGVHCYVALYDHQLDYFREYDPGRYNKAPIDVTHFLVLPDSSSCL